MTESAEDDSADWTYSAKRYFQRLQGPKVMVCNAFGQENMLA